MIFPEPATFAVFLIAAIVLLVTPGPAVLYIVTRSLAEGRTAGVASTLGVAAGSMMHVLAAVLGVSALLLSSAIAFNLVKYAGAAYLVYLGVCKLLGRESEERPAQRRGGLRSVFWQGAWVNLLNPKTALFFFAFLPQFVDTARGPVVVQLLALGVLFVLMGILSDGTYALLAGTVAQRLRTRPVLMRAQRYLVGGVFIGLGLSAALSGSGRK